MKRSLLPLAAFPVLVAFSSELGQDLAFAPAQGLTLTKTFSSVDEVSMDEMSVKVNGTEQDAGMSEMEQTTATTLEVVVTDEYGPIRDGRPATLKRTYDKVSSAADMTMSVPMMGDVDMSMIGESELEGEVVLFTWNDEEGAYDITFAEDQGSDEELLEDLTENTDLRGILPTEAVSEGDTWEVEPEVLRDLLAFGGALKLDVEVEGDAGFMGGMGGAQEQPSPDQFLGDLDGTITAEHGGTREHEGQQVAVIQLTIEINAAKDMTEFFQETMAEAEMPEGMEMDMEIHSSDMEFEIEGSAVALWSLEGDHLVSIEMNAETGMTVDQAMAMSMAGMGDMDMESTVLLSGSQTITLTVESSSAQ